MKFKIVNGILVVLAGLFLAAAILVGRNSEDTVIVIGRLAENTVSDFSFLFSFLLFFAACIIQIVRLKMNHEPIRALLVLGAAIFLIPLLYCGNFILGNLEAYHLVNEIESPDGEHTLYYYETILKSSHFGVEKEGVCVMRRKGFFEYEKLELFADFDTDRIEWGDDEAHYLFYELKYSTYGD